MCVFRYRKLKKLQKVPKSKAIIAYKGMGINVRGEFHSPLRQHGVKWEGRTLRHPVIHGAQFRWPDELPGIHCVKTAKAARLSGARSPSNRERRRAFRRSQAQSPAGSADALLLPRSNTIDPATSQWPDGY